MTLRYRVSPTADTDLDHLAAYLAREASLETALRFYDAAATTFEAIAQAPGVGERWPSSHPRLANLRVRSIEGFENHLVYYRPTEDGIEIIRVMHGARDLDNIFDAG
ncbi:type II toxin-antitoxin system RelE/ParE family toxin [Tundrisphaera lichenicola]|uniref:type II toxin-antitoxin system RelE/ParE family toxin n=1 Tax=Tundrisphaera lichenicola TaxID=2029860 RepID=UPI003EC05808